MTPDPSALSFWEHVEELRLTIIRSLLVVLLTSLACFLFSDHLIHTLARDYGEVRKQEEIQTVQLLQVVNNGLERSAIITPANSTPFNPNGAAQPKKWLAPGESQLFVQPVKPQLAVLSPIEGFITSMKLSVWTGLIISSPVWFYLVVHFILPALHPEGRRIMWVAYLAGLSFFALGLAFGYYVTLPIATQYLYDFASEVATIQWSLSAYIGYAIMLSTANGFAFELFVVLLLLLHLGVLQEASLRKWRRHVVIGMLLLGAILTPPDVITQCLVALPLILLFEIALLYGRIIAGPRLPRTESVLSSP